MIDVTRGSTDCAVAAPAPPLGPAGGIRGDVMSNHEIELLGDRARAPCRSLRAVHRASRDRAFCGRAFRGGRIRERFIGFSGGPVGIKKERRDEPRPTSGGGRGSGSHRSIRRAWSMPDARVASSSVEWFARRARQVRGERPEARTLWFAHAMQQPSKRVSRLPSARRSRRRCPCRVSARRRGRHVRCRV
jgi:hypothetical protein